ncbi:MAG TPA: hypothetical protein VI585_16475 [Candidatus Binatia bacterium]
MKAIRLAAYATLAILASSNFSLAQHPHDSMKRIDKPATQPDKAPVKSSSLKPAEGASVKILSPTKGQTFKGDQVPIQFKLVKGKAGHHVHAYVDNELMGMFEGEKGTLNGIKPGAHVLMLRVVTADHKTELDASDEVSFAVK